jgi:hypothetical protein
MPKKAGRADGLAHRTARTCALACVRHWGGIPKPRGILINLQPLTIPLTVKVMVGVRPIWAIPLRT